MPKISFDSISLATSSREFTPEGYLCAPGRVARPGIQEYLAFELGLPGDPNRLVNVYRPEEEVFNAESLATYEDSAISDDHPLVMVTADNYREIVRGHVKSAGRVVDGWVVADLLIKDKATIDAILSGKAELSAGYTAEYCLENGTTADGVPYEMVQRDIKINHVAVVDAARAGEMARIFDSKPQGALKMTQRRIVLDSKRKTTVTLDEDAAAVVEQAIAVLESDADDAQKKADEAQAAADDLKDKMDGMQDMVSDAAILARVKSVVTTLDTARKLVPSFDAKGVVDTLAIKRDVMASLKPSRNWADKSAAYVEAAFDAAADESDDEDKKKDDKKDMTNDARATLDSLGADTRKFADARNGMDGTKAYNSFLNGGAK